LLQNGKPNHVHQSENGVTENAKPKCNGGIEERTTNGLLEKGTPRNPVPEKRISTKTVPQNRTPSKLVLEKQTPNKVPGKRTPSKLVPEKPWR
jgi:hypothetical protein